MKQRVQSNLKLGTWDERPPWTVIPLSPHCSPATFLAAMHGEQMIPLHLWAGFSQSVAGCKGQAIKSQLHLFYLELGFSHKGRRQNFPYWHVHAPGLAYWHHLVPRHWPVESSCPSIQRRATDGMWWHPPHHKPWCSSFCAGWWLLVALLNLQQCL